ncbi:aspartate dehydrogenase [Verticiella sediminum]|uniref:L-aspartate dehydrogenase n=1 Tax=Verticiella sediminum TaxID=1247510 RepID=A0A556AB27_9BURK|nr:aspartate dehydrogenase [Verticiella sediminum]TSH90090.1 aspartate dehydrogenase [Verticiella sediminum]
MLNVAIIGCGAIAQSVMQGLDGRADIAVASVIVPADGQTAAREALAALAHPPAVHTALAQAARPDLLVECAGHGAIAEHVLPALEAGIACVVVSIGALSEPGLAERLADAAARGHTRVELLSGAIGGIDALAAGRLGGLDEVVYTGRKPPHAWQGTPAAERCVLAELTEATEIFAGSAREAAAAFPKNANVAATIALAGLGLEATTVRLIADPGVTDNVHHVRARGAFGEFELTMRGKPLASNPKTSSLTVYSVLRAIVNRAAALVI